jgi:lipopolysaccharide exporter
LKKYISSDFFKSVLTLASGTALAQFVPVLLLPLLSRIYLPEDFGILAIYTAFFLFISPYSGGRYEQAIMLPKTDLEAKNILVLSALISFVFNFLILCFILLDALVFNYIQGFNGISEFGNFIYLIPVSTFLVTSCQALLIWHNRKQRIKLISYVKVGSVLVMLLFQILFGYLNINLGLLYAVVISHVANFIFFIFPFIKEDFPIINQVKWSDMKTLAIQHKEFPLLNSIQSIFDNLHHQGIVFLFAKYYGASSLGNFGMANRIVGAPLRLIGESFGHVLYQKASELKNTGKTIYKQVSAVISTLSILSVLFLIVMILSSKTIIVFLLGEEWAVSGVYVRIMSVYFAFRLISAPIATIPFVISKQKMFLFLSSIGNSLGLITFGIAAKMGYSDVFVISAYTITMSIYYLIFIMQVYFQSKKFNNY